LVRYTQPRVGRSDRLATKEDRPRLLRYFAHYGVEEVLTHRVDCYTSHNVTVVAKDKDEIVGTLQWHVKEDPN
jgi:shikimate kinase